MNTKKVGSYGKLIAFFLVVIILLSTFAIAAGGWQLADDKDETPDDGALDDGTTDNDGNTIDKNKNDDNENEENQEPIIPEPKYYDYITGIEVTESQSQAQQIAYVIDSNSPLYGIADCSVLIEFPIENNDTRFLMIANPAKAYEKIGSISYDRKYITNLAYAFGATVISLKNDDTIDYNSVSADVRKFSLMNNLSSYYTEYTYFAYTSPNLFNVTNLKYNSQYITLPYQLAEVDTQCTCGTIKASSISIPYGRSTSLVYSNTNEKYTLTKSNSNKIDVSSPDEVSFDNAFILFADSMTYESASATQVVINTLGSGSGYYAHDGYAETITWVLDESGNFTFYNSQSEKLAMNRGSSYIAFVKSSNMPAVTFS